MFRTKTFYSQEESDKTSGFLHTNITHRKLFLFLAIYQENKNSFTNSMEATQKFHPRIVLSPIRKNAHQSLQIPDRNMAQTWERGAASWSHLIGGVVDFHREVEVTVKRPSTKIASWIVLKKMMMQKMEMRWFFQIFFRSFENILA